MATPPRAFPPVSSPWELDVRYLKGVGDKLGSLLNKADIRTFWDLLLSLPRVYEDRRKLFSYEEMWAALKEQRPVMAMGMIEKIYRRPGGPRGRSLTEALVRVLDKDAPPSLSGSPRIVFTWFHDPAGAMAKRYPEGSVVFFRGKVQDFRGNLQMVHPELQKSEAELPEWEFGGFIPTYREASGISTRVLRRIMALALQRPELNKIPESLPANLKEKLGLGSLVEALRELHFPKNWQPKEGDLKPGGLPLVRVAFEELFMMALALHMRRSEWEERLGVEDKVIPKLKAKNAALDPLKKLLPFELTAGQTQALGDIVTDLRLEKIQAPMHRLLQGDVGSGKTVVAFLSALLMMDEGYQVALMAPTEILADQHYQNFGKFFPERAHEAMLLKGALSAKKKNEVRDALQSGKARFVIGTQALLTHDTLFEKLGLVIVDEQHRFGVEQRLNLKKGDEEISPHLLVMTATPIPRSLALTIYGDLNLSVVRDKPVGRQPIETHVLKRRAKDALGKRLLKFLEEDRQLYLVYPLVEESEEIDLQDVVNAHKDWTQIFKGYSAGLLHGRMKSAEKEAVMRAFKAGEIRALVSTTVIEVGVDVPNATVIMIEHAERFGLSQLHQLRGRVGRGPIKSYCILVGPDNPGPQVEERLRVLEQSEDGFVIAEKDLEIRGPGEFLGRRQSGLPGFRVAHILRDAALLELARDEAQAILYNDPKLELPENRSIRLMLDQWWRGRLELTLSG